MNHRKTTAQKGKWGLTPLTKRDSNDRDESCCAGGVRPHFSFCAIVFLCFTLIGQAEVLDRIVALVEGHVVTLSDLRQEREIRAAFEEKPIAADVTLAKELVDTYLIERQIADYPNIDVTDAEVNARVQQFGIGQITAPGVKSDPPRFALTDATGRIMEVSASGIRDAVRRRIRAQRFFDIKFRQLIRPTDDEVRKYYEEVFVPEARAKGLQSIPPLTDSAMAMAIRENVIQESLDHEVNVWLEAIRRRSRIEIFE